MIKDRRLTAVATVMAAVAAATVFSVPAASIAAGTHPHASAAVNLIRDPGLEQAKPDTATDKVPTPGWSRVKGSQFTAVAWGNGSPGKSSPGPKNRGKNYFSGGNFGATSGATQLDSLTHYTRLIRSGLAEFKLSGWLGGFATQGDHATLTVTWESASGAALGHVTLGPVTEAQRKGISGELFRSKAGRVPAGARQALFTLRMIREAGEYNDGSADNLSLTISRAS